MYDLNYLLSKHSLCKESRLPQNVACSWRVSTALVTLVHVCARMAVNFPGPKYHTSYVFLQLTPTRETVRPTMTREWILQVSLLMSF